ncbi:MAG: response regulator transcription factor [Candidatus Dojkabacteria bacterium]
MGKKLLIVEDEKPIARALELKLSNSGFEVTVALDGQKAIDLVDNGEFDLILLDLVMPNLDGFGFLTQLKEKGKKIPVIVTSNLSQDEDIEKAKQMGAVGYYVKSNTPLADIVDKINQYFAK